MQKALPRLSIFTEFLDDNAKSLIAKRGSDRQTVFRTAPSANHQLAD
jgi:hypothetical protein